MMMTVCNVNSIGGWWTGPAPGVLKSEAARRGAGVGPRLVGGICTCTHANIGACANANMIGPAAGKCF